MTGIGTQWSRRSRIRTRLLGVLGWLGIVPVLLLGGPLQQLLGVQNLSKFKG